MSQASPILRLAELPSSGVATCTRRRVLCAAGCTMGMALFGAVAPGCGAPTGSPPTGPVPAGNVSELSVGAMHVVSNVVVARDADGVYAMSAICTHAGCFVTDAAGTIAAGLYCPCHGSAFDGEGVVTNGPAPAALAHYTVTIAADGSITVDGSQPVAASTRTPAT
jgi:cytochrome b6-f complex iron-sulfur subunit